MAQPVRVVSASEVFKTVGVLGGGQLGRMMAQAAHRLGARIVVLDPAEDSPAGQVAHKQVVGNFRDVQKIAELAAECDVLTVEIEHVNADALADIAAAPRANGRPLDIQPSPRTIKLIQDKYLQKAHLSRHNIPLPPFFDAPDEAAIAAIGATLGYPLMLKSRLLAYDGRGNAVVSGAEDIPRALKSLVSQSVYVEGWVTFTKELAVMVARDKSGAVVSYPVVETIQRNSICDTVVVPAAVSAAEAAKARALAESAIRSFEGAGIFGVELFLLPSGDVLLNEIAPRPHNSGHYTIEASVTCQFEQHLRAVLGLPLGDTSMRVGAATMINILGEADGDEGMRIAWDVCGRSLSVEGTSLHWYGKRDVRKGRKMGHITVTGSTPAEVAARVSRIRGGVVPTDGAVAVSPAPVVGIIMGSDSDLPTMRAAAQVLTDFGVPFELTVVSAHRTPLRMVEYARAAHTRGIKVIIAAAGGAAHLPGMVAALTPLPVIGVPVPLSYLDGQDSLYSIVQMPRGVPVATVAIGNSTNAGLLAVRMIGGCSDPALLQRMADYQARMEAEVLAKVDRLEKEGWDKYQVAPAHK